MRPRTLDEFFGQEHIIGAGRLLRRAIQADQLSSIIFYGPPGTGKTTLARIIANTTEAHFISLNAVLAGVKDLRSAIDEARERRDLHRQRTILFVDEVHRWNRAQQDALLPWVENGIIIFIGATTENPYFEVIKPLLSRSRIFQLKSLGNPELLQVARTALSDPDRGYGRWKVEFAEEALSHLVEVANGDARSLLNAVELAVETTSPAENGAICVDMAVAEESIQRRAVLYDKEGEVHYDTASAFIKSLRGSDPDAALYWMARMVYGGEDPRFILRRMLIFAGEDVGLADPEAIRVVVACAQALDYVGMPEGRFHLAEAALYLATAPKSNSAMGFFDALSCVEKEKAGEMPTHLRDDNRDAEGFGHGTGYLYPHAYRDHWVAQQYLPDFLQGRMFYQPSQEGHEQKIGAAVAKRREAQLAAMAEGLSAMPEILTFTGSHVARDRDVWLARTVSTTGDFLGRVRDRLLDAARLERHHLVADINAGSGLLTWEALRRAPEGGVWSLAFEERDRSALQEQAGRLPEMERPVVLLGGVEDLPRLLAQRNEAGMLFDAIVGRNLLSRREEQEAAIKILFSLLRPRGVLSLAQNIPRYTQRLYRLVDLSPLGNEAVRIAQAEETIYHGQDDRVTWDEQDLKHLLSDFADTCVHLEKRDTQVHVTSKTIEEWFGAGYGQRLRAMLAAGEVEQLRALFLKNLANRTVPWTMTLAMLTAVKP